MRGCSDELQDANVHTPVSIVVKSEVAANQVVLVTPKDVLEMVDKSILESKKGLSPMTNH